jgi:hypothetical protein
LGRLQRVNGGNSRLISCGGLLADLVVGDDAIADAARVALREEGVELLFPEPTEWAERSTVPGVRSAHLVSHKVR